MNSNFWIKKMPQYSMVIFIFLNITAMMFYTGGNINNPDYDGYSFIRNFFSDLGRRYSLSGESNLISCVLFNSSLTIVGLTFITLFYKGRTIFTEYSILVFLATIFGVYSGFSYVGVAFTPADLYLKEHIFFAHWAFRALFASSILYSILIFKTDGFDNKYAYAFIIFGFMVLFYVLYSEVVLDDPRINPASLIKHVVAQKMVVFWILLAVYIYSIGVGKFLFRKV